jgi:uncharacterized membrane protein
MVALRRSFFWLTAAIVLAIAAHIAYLLYVPKRALEQAIDAALNGTPSNKFVILDPAVQAKLLPFSTKSHVVGVCKFDVSKHPVRFSATVREGFWTFAVYTIHGKQVYSLTDTEADTNSFNVDLSLSPGYVAQVLGGGDDAEKAINDELGWRVSMSDSQGLAVLWQAVGDPLLRPETEEILKSSRCLVRDDL